MIEGIDRGYGETSHTYESDRSPVAFVSVQVPIDLNTQIRNMALNTGQRMNDVFVDLIRAGLQTQQR